MLKNILKLSYIKAVSLVFFSLIGYNNALKAQAVTLDNVRKYFESGELLQARYAIDSISTHTSLNTDPKTWNLKALIYRELYLSNKIADSDSLYRIKACDALIKSIELDTPKKLKKSNLKLGEYLAATYFNDGKLAFDNRSYNEASGYFVRYMELMQSIQNKVDDNDALFFAGYSAYLAKDSIHAEEYLSQALIEPYTDTRAYIALGKLYQNLGDEVRRLEILESGANQFPSNRDIAIDRANALLANKRFFDAIPVIEKVYNHEPDNLEVQLALASTYERVALESQKNKEKFQSKAKAIYEQVIKQYPDNFMAHFNLGAMIFNKAVDKQKAINQESIEVKLNSNIPDDFAATFKAALPYIERANEIDPDHVATLTVLETIYQSLLINDRLYAIRERLEKLKNN